MAAIFVNYRGGGHSGSVEAIAEQLRRHFGDREVFLDVHSIPAGARYPDELRRRIAAAHVVLVVIHAEWSAAADRHGRRLLDQPGDWVGMEIELALRLGKLVIQVLLDTPPLTHAELPPPIRDLANRQARPIRRGSFTEDVRRLAEELTRLVPGLGSPLRRGLRSRPVRIAAAALLVAVLGTAGLLIFRPDPDSRDPASTGGDHSTSPPGQPGQSRPAGTYLAFDALVTYNISLTPGPADINGSTYDRSLSYTCGTICVEPKSSAEFDLGKRYRTLDVVAGVLQGAFESDQVGHFEVYVDDTLRAEADATLREPKELHVDVTNGLRLRLVAYREGTVTDLEEGLDNQTRGISNKLPSLAWGDPRVSG